MSKPAKTILKVAIHRDDSNPVFGEDNLYLEIDDESGGPFIVISSNLEKVAINPDEIDLLFETAKELILQFKEDV